MRTFLLIAQGQTDDTWTLNGLPNAGRMDLVCRAVNSAFWISNGLRQDVTFYVLLKGPPNGPVTLKFVGREMRYFHPDERNIASHIKRALGLNPKKDWVTLGVGLYAAKKSLTDLLMDFDEVCVLDKSGEKLSKPSFDCVYVLGDNKGFTKDDLEVLGSKKKFSLGDTEYLASHCISVLNYMLD